ncbi:MAG: ABC transporter substrate-binding protein [Anaerolineae bacterium]|nr:ABC transporter substrate-binding protein [Anaerolineae bacterium]
MLRHQRYFIWTLLMAFAIIIAGCGTTSSTPTPEAATPVSVQLSWTHEYSLSAFYTAELNKHFAENNLAVTLKPGGFVEGAYIEPIDQVVSGDSDFGTIGGTSILEARAAGKPVVAIASLMQRGPIAVISLADTNIQTPADLVGKTVTVAEGGSAILLDTLLASQGIDKAQVNIVPRTDFGIDPLANGDVDALVGWIINEGVQVQEAGLEPSFLLMSDYGIPDYNFLIFTTEQMIQDHPDTVQRFVQAMVDGMTDAVDNPDQAIDYTLQYNSELDRDQQLRRLQSSIPLIRPAGVQVGRMEASVWESIQTIMLDSGLLTEAVDLSKAYDLTFLEKLTQ